MAYTFKDYLKNKDEIQENSTGYSYKDYKRKKKKGRLIYDTDVVNDYFKSASKTVNEVGTNSKNLTYDYAKNGKSKFDTRFTEIDRNRNYVENYIESLKGVDDEAYKTLSKQFDSTQKALNSSSAYLRNINDFASQFKDEETFKAGWNNIQFSNKYKDLQTSSDYEKIISENFANGPKNADELEEFNWLKEKRESSKTSAELYAEYEEEKKKLDAIDVNPAAEIDYTDEASIQAYNNSSWSNFHEQEDKVKSLKSKADAKFDEEQIDKYFYNLDDKTKHVLENYLYNYGKIGVSPKENQQYKEDYLELRDKTENFDELQKWYKRGYEDNQAQEKLTDSIEFAEEHPVLASAKAVATAIPATLETGAEIIGAWGNEKLGGDGYYNTKDSILARNNAIQNTVSEGIDNGVANFLYNGSMSIANMLPPMAIGAITKNPAITLAIMGSQAGVSEAHSAVERGATLDQALLSGIAAGITEAAMEKVPLDNLFDLVKTGKTSGKAVLGNIFKQAGTEAGKEAGEEGLTTIANTITDELINRDLSQLNISISNNEKAGYSPEEARKKALTELGIQIGLDSASGALSGFVLGGGATALGSVGNYVDNRNSGKKVVELGNLPKLVEASKQYDDKKISKLAGKAEKKNGKPNYSAIGKLQKGIAKYEFERAEKIKKIRTDNTLTKEENNIFDKLVNNQDLTEDEKQTISNNKKLSNAVQELQKTGTINIEAFATAMSATETTIPDLEVHDIPNELKDLDIKGKTVPQALNITAQALGLNEDATKRFIENYESKSDVVETAEESDINRYAVEFALYHSYGRTLFPYNNIDSTNHKISTDARLSAYEAGKNEYTENAKLQYALTQAQKKHRQANNGYAKGIVDTSRINKNALTPMQRASVDYVSCLAEFGVNVEFYQSQINKDTGEVEGENGHYYSATHTILIDVNALSDGKKVVADGIIRTAFHEMTHIAEHSKEYEELRKAVIEAVGAQAWENEVEHQYNLFKKTQPKRFQKMSEPERKEYAAKEATAEACTALVKNSKALLKMAEEHPGAVKTIINKIKEIIAKIQDFLSKHKNDYYEIEVVRNLKENQEALQKVVDLYDKAVIEGIKTQNARKAVKDNSGQKNNRSDIDRTDVVFADDNVQYSIRHTTENIPVVVVEDDILQGVPKSQWIKTVKDVMSKNFSNGIPVKGRLIKVNKFSRNEFTESKYTKFLRTTKTHSDIYEDKLKSANNLDEILLASTNYINEDLKHIRKDSIKEFARGDVLMQIGINRYSAKVIIGFTSSNSMLLYDVIDLTPTMFTLKKVGTTAQQKKTVNSSNVPTNNNIPQKDTTVNNQSMQKGENNSTQSSVRDVRYLEAVKNNDLETAQRMVDEVAKEKGYTIKAYHGTRKADFTIFKRNVNYFSSSSNVAQSYAPNNEMYSVYLNMHNPFILDAKNNKWSKIPIDEELISLFDTFGSSYYTEEGVIRSSVADVVAVIEEAVDEGELDYDGVIIKNVDDTGSYYKNNNENIADDYIVFNRNNIKSADPVTYDDNGEVIPLSQRFDDTQEDIRYSVRDDRTDYTNIDLSTLDDKQLKVYNNRGWANSLFTDEDLVLLGEKYNELNKKTRQRTDNILGDGSRIVEVNNKLVLIGGTFNDPIIHNVLVINADNETYAEIIKGELLYGSQDYRRNQTECSEILNIIAEDIGKRIVRGYNANDFKYFKGRNTERATLPSNFKNYGYTEQFKDRGRNNSEVKQFSIERGRDLSDDELIERAIVKSEQTPDFEALFEDEDLSFDFVTQSGKERFEKLLKDNPTLALDTVYSSFANAILKKLNISPQMPEVRYNYTIKKILSDYNIEATQRAEFEEILRKFIGAVKNNEADFPEALNEFIAGCKQTLNFSSVPNENETLKTVKDVVKGKKIVIPDEAVSEINSNYGSIRNYRNKLLGHKVYVTLEKNVGTDLSKVNNAVRIDDLAVDILSELGYDVYNGATAYKYDGHEWDSLGGFYNLEHLLNDPKLATRYSNPYLDGHSETIDVAAVQMAFDTMIEFLSLTNGTIENYRQALNKAKQENYKAESTILKYKKLLTEIDEINTISEKLGEFEGTDNEELLKRKKELLDKLKTQAPIRQLLAEQRKIIQQQEEANYQLLKDRVTKNYNSSMENRRKAESKRMSKRIISELNKFLYRAKPENAIKDGQREVSENLLALCQLVFSPTMSNEEIVKSGFTEGATPREKRALENYAQILKIYEHKPMPKAEKAKLYSLNSELNEFFRRTRISANEANMNTAFDNLANAYSSLQNSDLDYIRLSYDPEVLADIEFVKTQIKGQKVKDLSFDELEMFRTVLRTVYTSIRNSNKLFSEGLKSTYTDLSNTVIKEVMKYYRPDDKSNIAVDSIMSHVIKNITPVYLFRRIGSNELTKVFWEVQKGEQQYSNDLQEIAEFKDKMMKKYDYKSYDFKKSFEFTDANGVKFTLTRDQIMEIFVLSRREQGMQHLLGGGFTYSKGADVAETEENKSKKSKKEKLLDSTIKKQKHIGSENHPLTTKIIDEITSKLDNNLKNYAIEMQKFLSVVMAAKGNEVSQKLYGVNQFNEETYWQITASSDFIGNIKSEENKGTPKLKHLGFTKPVDPNANNPVEIKGFENTWDSHCNKMAYYHSLTLPLEDLTKISNFKNKAESKSIESTIRNAHGSEVWNQLAKLIEDFNGKAEEKPRLKVAKAMSLMKKNAVLGNIAVIVQQPTAIIRAMAYINPVYFQDTLKLKGVFKGHKATYEEMMKYCPVAFIKKMGSFDVHKGVSGQEYLSSGINDSEFKKFMDKSDDFFGKAPQYFDEIGWISLWHAVQRETEAKHNLKLGTEENLVKAGERLNEIIVLTQVYDSMFSRSGAMRSSNEFVQALTSFMGEPTLIMNMAADAIMQCNRTKNKGHLTRVLSSLVASSVATKLLASLVYALRDDDEEKGYWEKYGEALIDGFWDVIMPLNYFPILKDVYSTLRGYTVERADTAVLADIVNLHKKCTQDGADWMDTVSFISAIPGILGMPTYNVWREIKGVINTIGGATNDITKLEFSLPSVYDKKYEQYWNEGYTEQECKSKAMSDCRSKITRTLKSKYLSAIQNKDFDTANKYREYMYKSGYYDGLNDVDKALDRWRNSQAEDDKRKSVAKMR